MQRRYRIGTRGSKLALVQANEVARRIALAAHAHVEDVAEIVVISTQGDRVQDRVFPLQQAIDHEPVRQHGRHVLHRVNGDIDPRVEKLFLDLLREEPLAAEFGEIAVLHPVALRGNDDDLRRLFRRVRWPSCRKARWSARLPCAAPRR